MSINTDKVRKDFPILSSDKKIIYFDNACMTLRPKQVIDKITEYYLEYPSCGERSQHKLSKRVTAEVEDSRKTAQRFLNAKSEKEIIFSRNTTESINLIANSLRFGTDSTVICSDREHNSNLVPWQILSQKKGVKHIVSKSKQDNTFDLENFSEMMDKNVKLVSVVQTSNLDGYTTPIKEITKIAHDNSALVLVDGAQSAPHKDVDVRKLDVDFFACSGHKMLGPTGTGILYGKSHLLEELDPFIVGGETVFETTYDSFSLEKPPARFEAGLQNYAGIIGLGEAMRYLMKIGKENIADHEKKLNSILSNGLSEHEKVDIVGVKDPELRSGITSFNIRNRDPHEVAMMLDQSANIMMRSGAHCLHSWFNERNLQGSVRASLYFYNTEDEVRFFLEKMQEFIKNFC